MEDKNIKKYHELEEEYFSSCPNWTYEWRIGSSVHILDFDFDNDRYDYSIDSKYLKSFSTIYEALDEILIEKRTLKQLLLETDFDFYSIT